MRGLKRFLVLIVIYTAIIFGIFAIQFRNDFTIRKNINGLKVTLNTYEASPNQISLKNDFSISFNGIVFSANDAFPVMYIQDGQPAAVKLLSYNEDENSISLLFENDVSVLFKAENDSLVVEARMPEEGEAVRVGFAPEQAFEIKQRDPISATLVETVHASKEPKEFILVAPEVFDTTIVLKNDSEGARYSFPLAHAPFSIEDVAEMDAAKKQMYDENLAAFSQMLITQFLVASHTDNFQAAITEQTAVAFLAAMTNAGRHNEGINAVPEIFARGTKHTHLSAPFFGLLSSTLPMLNFYTQNLDTMIQRALDEKTLEVFTEHRIAQYIYTQGNRGIYARIVAMPASLQSFNLSLSQAAGILRSFAYLREAHSTLAAPLEPVLEECVGAIVDAVVRKGDSVVLIENELTAPMLTTLSAGDALISYGILMGNKQIENLGYWIVNSHSSAMENSDLITKGHIYEVLFHRNKHYPHFELLKTFDANNVWAWTIASNIDYSSNAENTVTLAITFPVGLAHYMFIPGLRPFRRMQIYGVDVLTDARFETYNSSGYVYRPQGQTMFLKSNHRERIERVRLFNSTLP